MRAPGRNRAVRSRAIAIAIILATIPWALLIPGDVLRAEEPAPLPPAWACLPEHTLLVLRCPSLPAFVDALAKQTRLGAAMNDAGRWKNALEHFGKQWGTEPEEVVQRLAEYDLKIDDWRSLVSGEFGYAAIAAGKTIDPESELHEVFAGWLEPSDELGDRLWKALDRWTSQAVADHAYLKRVDESLSDFPVICLSANDPPIPHGTLSFAGGFSGRGLSFSVSNHAEKKKKEKADEPASSRGEYHLLVARVGRRFLLVHDIAGTYEDEEEAQTDSAASLEACRQMMAQVLERHRQRGEASQWLREAVAQTPRDGTVLFELFGNLPLLAKVEVEEMDQEVRDAKEPDSAFGRDAWDFFKSSLAVGAVVMRGSLQENRWERTIRVGLPQERAGLLSLFDAGSLPPEPADWVPATAQSYSQINLDATPIAEQMRGLMQAARQDPKIGGALALVESQLHVDLAELISGLGPRMIFVEFADPPEGKQRVGPADAVLWQVRNDELWQKGLEAAASSFGQKLLKRDGYVGMQIPLLGDTPEAKKYQSSMPWLLAGHGHLLYVSGDDPTGPPLAHLPEPAAGGSNFRDSRAFKRVAELFPGDSCFAFQYTDRSSQAETKSWLNDWIYQLAKLRLIPFDASQGKSKEAQRNWSREWWSRLLGDESTQPLLTVEADRMTIEPDGVLHRWVLEFVPPER